MKRLAIAAVLLAIMAVLALVLTLGERGTAVAQNEPEATPEEREPAALVGSGEIATPVSAEASEERREVERPAPETPVPELVEAPAPPEPTATALGRLVDEATGEPVPFQEFDVGPPDDSERVETDAFGSFETKRAHPSGALSIRLRFDDGGQPFGAAFSHPIELAHDADDRRRADVPIKIGPTYELDLQLPAGVEPADLKVTLDAKNPVEDAWGLRAREASVREGERPWVRFQKPDFYLEPAPPWQLEVVAKETAWRGTAAVDSITGIYPKPVKVVLTQAAELGGRLETASGQNVEAFVGLTGPAGTKTYGPFEHGSYRIRWLDPGVYRLAVYSSTHEHPELEVELASGESKTLDLVVAARPLGGALAGVVRSEGRERYNDLRVILRSVEHVKLVETQMVQWQPGTDRGTFRFDGLATGEYKLAVFGHSTAPIEPELLDVSPPREDLEFVVRDSGTELRSYTITAVDAETGECIQGPELHVRPERGKSGMRMWTSMCEFKLGPYRPDDAFEWVLRCEGYETAWGDRSSFDADGSCEARVRRGWSGRVVVQDPDGTPLAGVAIVLPDGSSEATDVDGVATLRRDQRPPKLAFVYGDWRVTGGDVDADGSYTDTGFDVEVRLAPPD